MICGLVCVTVWIGCAPRLQQTSNDEKSTQIFSPSLTSLTFKQTLIKISSPIPPPTTLPPGVYSVELWGGECITSLLKESKSLLFELENETFHF